MKIKTAHNIPNEAFKLNGHTYSVEAISELAQNYINEGTENQIHLGKFILNWIDTSAYISVNTSGTTSKPTSISIPKKAFIHSAQATGMFFNLSSGDSALCCLPFSYIAAKMMFVRAWVLGLRLDIIEPSSSPLSAILKPYDFSTMVPLQVHNSIPKLHQIRILLVGGAPVSEDLANQLKDLNCTVFETFGMTETISHIAAKNISKGEQAFTVLPNISIAVDANSCLLVNAPKMTSKVLHTNDVVSLVSKDSFVWLGRYDHMINSGGLKIYPEQLENNLKNQIKNRFFISSIPDEILGQKIILIVEGRPNDLKLDFSKIDPKKRPKSIHYIKNFCLTKSGKIQRQKTLDMLNLNNP